MTQAEINRHRAAASLGLIPDEENPIFLFSQTHKDILVDIISGKIDTVQLARMEMWNRGLDMKTGKWIGWRKGDDSYQVA